MFAGIQLSILRHGSSWVMLTTRIPDSIGHTVITKQTTELQAQKHKMFYTHLVTSCCVAITT